MGQDRWVVCEIGGQGRCVIGGKCRCVGHVCHMVVSVGVPNGAVYGWRVGWRVIFGWIESVGMCWVAVGRLRSKFIGEPA